MITNELINKTSKEVITYLADKRPIVKISCHTYLLDGLRIDKALLNNIPLQEICGLDMALAYLNMSDRERKTLSEGVLKNVRDYVSDELSKEKQAKLEGMDFNLSALKLCHDIKTHRFLLFNLKERKISDMNPDSYLEFLIPEDRSNVKLMAKKSRFLFDPSSIEVNWSEEFESIGAIEVINLYKPPKWQLSGRPVGDIRCPDKIWDFLVHLFPNEICRKYVLSWMHHALVGKCQTYLVLNGKKGIGKNIFAEVLMQSLTGETNFNLVKQAVIDEKFNTPLKDKRVVLYDEIRATNKAQKALLKSYINDRASFEGKGVDATNVSDLHVSPILSNNDITDIFLEADDRRFNVPELTDMKLQDVWAYEEINEFVELIKEEDSEVMKQFGFWVLEKCEFEDLNPSSFYAGNKFWTIVYAFLRGWQKTILDAALNPQNGIDWECKNEGSTRGMDKDDRMPRPPQISAFLKEYKHKGSAYVGELNNGVIKFTKEIMAMRSGNNLQVELAKEVDVDSIEF